MKIRSALALFLVWGSTLAFADNHLIKWVKITPSGTGPSARAHHSAVYNPSDNSLIVFGGIPGRELKVWKLALTLKGTSAWSELSTAGVAPLFGTDSHSAVYDPADNSMVVFGGHDGTLYSNALHKLTLGISPSWGQLSPTTALPLATSNHTSVILTGATNRMVKFGGWIGSSSLWQLTLSSPFNWVQLPDVPFGRNGHSAIEYPADNGLIVFGGFESGYKNEVWKLTLGTSDGWVQVSPTGSGPAARIEHAAIYSPNEPIDGGAGMIVFGGLGSNGVSFNDVWRLTLGAATSTWTQLIPQYDGSPTERYGHSMNVFDTARSVRVVYGGETSAGASNEVWFMGPGTGFGGLANSATTMTWGWSRGWDATLHAIHDAGHTALTTSTAEGGVWLESGLSANTAYTRHLKSFRAASDDVEFEAVTKYTHANPPSGLTVIAGNSTSLTLAWVGNGATRFHLVKTTGSATNPVVPWTSTLKTWDSGYAETLYTDTGLTAEEYYWYTVHSYNGDGTLGDGTPTPLGVTLCARAGPKIPTGFSGGPASKTAVLWSWSDRSASNTAYLLVNSTTRAVMLTLTANAITAEETGLSPNTELGRIIQATDGISVSESIAFTAYSLASIPTGLTIAAEAAASVSLAWSGDGTRYSLERAQDTAGNPGTWAPLKTWGDGVTLSSAVDLSVSAGTRYWYRTRAYNGNQFLTDPSGSLRAATLLAGTPTAPTSTIQYTTGTDLTFSWTSGTVVAPGLGITGYHIQVGTSTGTGDHVSLTLTAVTSYPVTGGVNGLTYFARVRALGDDSFMSDWSSSSTGVIVDATAPSAPTLTSSTHPVSTDTYAISTVVVSLMSASDASGIAGYYYVFNQTATTVPTGITGTWTTSVILTFSSVQDGIWYVHAVARDNTGNTGILAAHLTLQVKTTIDAATASTLKFSDGTELHISSGTVASATQVTVSTPAPASLPSMVSDAYVVPTNIAREISLADGTTTLSQSLILVMTYTDAEVTGVDETKLKLAYWDPLKSQWVLIGSSSVSSSENKITARVDHFTLFRAVSQTVPSEALAGVSNYPNPFTIGLESTRIRYSLKDDVAVEIRVFDLLGTLVWERSMAAGAEGGASGTQEIVWDGTDKDGRQVGTGGYICLIKAGGKIEKVKIGVK